MTKLIVPLWSLLGRLFRPVVALLLAGVVITCVAGWLVAPPGQWLRPGADHEVDDRPGDRISVSVRVAHIWLPDRLVSLARRESWLLPEERHQQLRKILEGEDWRVLFYAFTVQVLQANGRVESFHFIRYPFRVPENVQELLDVMATAAGSPPKYPTSDYYSAAAVHVVPAGMSPQQLISSLKTAAPSHRSALPPR
jgi:hypothetical protein